MQASPHAFVISSTTTARRGKKSVIMTKSSITTATPEYKEWFREIKSYIRSQQIKAAIRVNTELLKVYWKLGKEISAHKVDAQWGSGFYETLSRDLKAEFPDMKGFSVTNLKYCKRFYELYSQSDIIRQQVVDELEVSIFNIPWGHHTEIIAKCKTAEDALFYTTTATRSKRKGATSTR